MGRETAMIQARKLGHIVLKVSDARKSKEFSKRDVMDIATGEVLGR